MTRPSLTTVYEAVAELDVATPFPPTYPAEVMLSVVTGECRL
jgi:hypothetical protein